MGGLTCDEICLHDCLDCMFEPLLSFLDDLRSLWKLFGRGLIVESDALNLISEPLLYFSLLLRQRCLGGGGVTHLWGPFVDGIAFYKPWRWRAFTSRYSTCPCIGTGWNPRRDCRLYQ